MTPELLDVLALVSGGLALAFALAAILALMALAARILRWAAVL